METKHDWDCLLVKAMGIALLTVAFTWLPTVFGGVAQLVAALVASNVMHDSAGVMRELQVQFMATSVGKIASFIALLLLARWVFGYPAILQRALKRVDDA